MKFKSAPVSVKATDNDQGTFEAIVSVFGNQDSYGDVVMPGAFTNTLSEWAEKGAPIPVYWSHRMDDPDYNIGYVLDAKETDEGLWVKAQIDLEGAKAQQVHRLLKGRRVTQFSFAYDEVDAGPEKSGESEYRALRELKLYEVGPTPIGANQETELIAVKAAAGVAEHLLDGVKAGREISTENEAELRKAHEAIGNILSSLDEEEGDEPPTDDQEKASTETSAKDEEPAGAKSEEPADDVTADHLAAEINLITYEGALL